MAITRSDPETPLWAPSREHVARTRMVAFAAYVADLAGRPLTSYTDLHRWSIDEPAQFWRAVWDFCAIIGTPGERVVVDEDVMPGARWFPDARLNFSENLLRRTDNERALVFWGEEKVKRTMSRAELRTEVARFATALRHAGVGVGDRGAAYMPNMPETIVAMLATASLGAVFTSASPDFGVQGVVDRFGQTTPKVLIACRRNSRHRW